MQSELLHLNWSGLHVYSQFISSELSVPLMASSQSSSLSQRHADVMHLPLPQRKADGGHDASSPMGVELFRALPPDVDEQFCSSELSQQSFAPSHIHDGWMQAVVFLQFCISRAGAFEADNVEESVR